MQANPFDLSGSRGSNPDLLRFVNQRLYQLSYCRCFVWLLNTGWLTQSGGDIRVSALHSSCTIQILCCPPLPSVR